MATQKETAFFEKALAVASLRSKLQLALQRKAEIDADIAAIQVVLAEQETQSETALDEVVNERSAIKELSAADA